MMPLEGVYSIAYNPPVTLKKFHRSDAKVRGIRGPIGSAKSTACCFEIFRRANEQKPGPDGIRHSRWAVVRNTNPQLETTTIKTWKDWFPEHVFGKMNMRVPYTHVLKWNDVELEVIFLALDRSEDIKKLLSLELTGVWINEAREVPIEIIRGCQDRVGRYPSKRAGGPTWYGIIMDTNPPPEEHWWAIYDGATPLPADWQIPRDWQFFTQPPAMLESRIDGRVVWTINPKAENIENLPDGYYENVIDGKPNTYIRVYVGNKYGTTVEGKAIYGEEYNEDIHLSRKPLFWIPGCTIVVGLDFGRTPAACFSQQTPRGQWQDIHELVCKDMGAVQFAKLLYSECERTYPDAKFAFWGDPAGDEPSTDEKTYFEILHANKIPVRKAPSQDWVARREAGASPLNRMVDGMPGYLLSCLCPVLRSGFNGQFRYKKLQVSGTDRYSETPDKNDQSHVHEARQYGYLGGGEGRVIKGKSWSSQSENKVSRAKIGFNPLSPRGGSPFKRKTR